MRRLVVLCLIAGVGIIFGANIGTTLTAQITNAIEDFRGKE